MKSSMKKRILAMVMVCGFCLGISVSQAAAMERQDLKIEETAIAGIEKALEQIEELGYSQADLEQYEEVLPQKIAETLNTLITISELNISTEEKVATLLQEIQSDCSSFASTWVTLQVLLFVFTSIIPIIPLPLISLLGFAANIYFWLTIFCILGIV